jgi:hypothetical protein
VGATTTHGNAGYLTFYRNYSSSVFAPPAVAGSTAAQTGNMGADGDGAEDVAALTLFRHGNYDTVYAATEWDPSNDVRTLPSSLYRAGRPDWWPSGTPWPWVGPDLDPMVGTLPAKDRSDRMPP